MASDAAAAQPMNGASMEPPPCRPPSGKTVLDLLLVLLPGIIALALQAWTGNIVLALCGVPASIAMATLVLRWRGSSWRAVGLNGAISRLRLLITVPIAVAVLLVLSYLLIQGLVKVYGQPDLSAFAGLRNNIGLLLVWFAVIWTLAAFGEEMLFRGIVLNWLYEALQPYAARWPAWMLALLATSALFGVAHSYQGMTGIIGSACLGLGFGLVYLVSKRNLWPSILTHGLFDTIAFLMLFARLSATNESG
jgi:membrane protease YdiL (CAAX protease family)